MTRHAVSVHHGAVAPSMHAGRLLVERRTADRMFLSQSVIAARPSASGPAGRFGLFDE